MATTDELLDALMKNCKKPEGLLGKNGLLNQLTGISRERVNQDEMAVCQGNRFFQGMK